MRRRTFGAGLAVILAALVASGCGLSPYEDIRYETMIVSGDVAELSSVVTLTEDEDTGAVLPAFAVETARLVMQAQPGAPAATVESIMLDYYWADGTEIAVEGEHSIKLNLYVPAGFECEIEGCFGDTSRLPAPGEEVTSETFAGMPFTVAERLYLDGRSPDNAYAMATVHAYAGAQDVSFEMGPIALIQEVVQE